MEKYYRDTYLREDIFGIDSIQGYLEMAEWYNNARVNFVCHEGDEKYHGSMRFVLDQLESDGKITIEWEKQQRDDNEERNTFLIKQISLTLDGHKLLDELRAKSKAGNLKKRIDALAWTIATAAITSIVTTFVILLIKD